MSHSDSLAGMIYDAHIHLFEQGYEDCHLGRPADEDVRQYEGLRASSGIERALCIGYEGEPKYRGNNAYILRLAGIHDWLDPLCYLDCTHPPTLSSLDELVELGARGFVFYVPTDKHCDALRNWPQELWQYMVQRVGVISVNVPMDLLQALSPVIESAPVPWLISHLGLPGKMPTAMTDAEIIGRLDPVIRLSALPHVRVKLSAFYALSDSPATMGGDGLRRIVSPLVNAFSTKRLHWGSDYSPVLKFTPFSSALDLLRQALPDEAETILRNAVLAH